MDILYFFAELRSEILTKIMLFLTEFGEETVFMVLAMAISLAACTSDSAAQKEDKENSDTKFTPAEREPDEDSVLGAVDSESVVWENEMLGLGFEAPEGWSFATDSELAEMAGVSSDLLKEYSDITEIAETFFDMAASDNDSKDNVNVTIDKLTSAQANGADLYGHLEFTSKEQCAAILEDSIFTKG